MTTEIEELKRMVEELNQRVTMCNRRVFSLEDQVNANTVANQLAIRELMERKAASGRSDAQTISDQSEIDDLRADRRRLEWLITTQGEAFVISGLWAYSDANKRQAIDEAMRQKGLL